VLFATVRQAGDTQVTRQVNVLTRQDEILNPVAQKLLDEVRAVARELE
jgi:hypothetical protein